MNVGYFVAGYIFDFVRVARSAREHRRLPTDAASTALLRQSRPGDSALPDNLFLAAECGATAGPQLQPQTATSGLWSGIAQTVRQSALETIALFRRLVGQQRVFIAARVLSVHWVSESAFLADGLRLSEIRRPRDGLARTGGETGRINAIDHHFPCARRRALSLSESRRIAWSLSAALFARPAFSSWRFPPTGSCGRRMVRSVTARSRLPAIDRPIHPYYVMSAHLPGDFLHRRSLLFAARLRICRGYRTARSGSILWLACLFTFSGRKTSRRHRRLAPGCVLSCTGAKNPATMWLIFALAASVAPLGLIFFRRYIRVPEAGRE